VSSPVNDFVENIVRLGFGSPCSYGSGLVVIETVGRKSGQPRTIPLLAQRFGNTLLVSTVREHSQWVRNLEVDENPTVVLNKESVPVKVNVRRFGRWTLLRLDLQP
jgi:deazaflavin-dependent oxidoreductase (nitroreductase family)